MKIQDWFDVKNESHLKAWLYLSKTGMWPENFLPQKIIFDNCWQVAIASKLADAYIKEKIGEN